MKGKMDKNFNSKEIESRWSKYWEDEDLFAPSGTGEPYSIVIPPPNVTGTLHMGHAFLNTIIDTLIRYQRMNGKNVLWQMGTDHAGIATQMVVERRLAAQGKNKRDMGREKFLAEVWKWKEMSSGTIEKQLRRLGASVDWKTSRFTMDDAYINSVIEAFVRLHEKGLVYRSKRLVNWDPVLQTAVSDLEVRAVEEPSTLYYIRYPFVDDPANKSASHAAHDNDNTSGGANHAVPTSHAATDNNIPCMVISTTRPETTLADGAVAVHPDDERYKSSVGRMVRVPGTDRIIPVIADEYVKPDFGSGCVKITPAHDFNDYEVGQRHTMETINLFTKDAHLNENAPPAYRGMDRYEARTKIVQDFKQQGLLAKEEKHSYSPPRGDRSGVILEPYLTDQWFIKMDTMAQRAIKAVQDGETKFVSPMWEKVYYNWLNEIQDWCVSRQLWWGHRIPAWYDEDGKPYVGRSQEEVRAKHNLDSSVKLRQDEDVLDTWFSSALWTFATMGWPLHENGGNENNRQQTFNPTDLLVTGFDIIFFWVARMIMATINLKDEVPFRNVYIHGLVRDGEGQKMSKSKGNILDPLDIIDGVELEELLRKRTTDMMQPDKAKSIAAATKKHFPDGIAEHGTDALRFTFCAMASTGRDLNFDTSRCIGYRNFCNKLWNATRYVLMQCTDADRMAAADKPTGTPNIIDQYMQWRFEAVTTEIRNSLDNYRIDLAAQSLYEFVWHEFCDWYIEFTKPILAGEDEQAKASTKQGLLSMLDNILHLAHPFIPFITEETWQHLHAGNKSKSVKSIMVSQFPQHAPKSTEEINKGNKKFAAVAWMKEFIQGVRVLRSELNIAPSISLELILVSDDKNEARWLEEHADIIKPIIKCNKLSSLTTASTKKPAAIARLAGKGEVLMPITENNRMGINREAEEKRLLKQRNTIDDDITKMKNKLNNKGFIDKAPDNIVKGVELKLQEQEAAWNKISEQIKDFISTIEYLDKDKDIASNITTEIDKKTLDATEIDNKFRDAPNNALDHTKKNIKINSSDAEFYYNQGLDKYKLKDYRGAINDFTQSIKINPKKAEAYNDRGSVKYNLEDYQGAIDDFNQAIKINPNYVYPYYNLGTLKTKLKDYKGAINDYNKAVNIGPNFPAGYSNRGNIKYILNDYKGAIDDYNKAIALDPSNVNTYSKRGIIKSQLKDYQGAIDDYNRAVELDPNNANIYYERANIKVLSKDYEGAIDDYNKTIELDPNNTNTYNYRGNIKYKLHDYKGAINDFTKAIDIDPNNANAYNSRGVAKHELKNYQEAIDDLTKAIDINPNNANTYFSRGNAKNELKNYKGAIDDYDKSIQIEPKNTDFFYNRGLTKNKLKYYQGAIEDFNKVIEINPNKAYSYNSRGVAKHQLKNYKGAIDDFNKAIEVNPNNAGAYNNRGLAKYELHDYKEAINDYDKSIEINPNNTDAYNNRGLTKYELKNYQGAIDDYGKFIEIDPNDACIYYNLGVLGIISNDYKGAIDACDKSIEIDPNNASAYYNRGIAKFALKDYKGAIDDITQYIKFDPNNADDYNIRGSAKNELKDYQGAINDRTKVNLNNTIDNAKEYIVKKGLLRAA